MGGVNKKVLAVGAVTLIAMAAMAIVYYSSYSTATVTAKKLIEVRDVSLSEVTMNGPSITTNADLGQIKIVAYDPDNNNSTINTTHYRLIIDLLILEKLSSDPWGNVRGISIAVYDGGNLKGFLTPWTPTLVIDDAISITKESATKVYSLKFNGIAYDNLKFKIGVRASVELIKVT